MKNGLKRTANFAGAFTSFCRGAPLEEIAQIFDIELSVLIDRVSREHWAALRASLPLGENLKSTTEMASTTEIKLAAIQANREANLRGWAKLREHAIEVIDSLRAGTLEMEKVFNSKLGVVRATVKPGPGDWLNIASYFRTLSDGTYRALGDFQSQDKPGQDIVGSAASQAPSITIILPNVIAQPRTGPDDAANQIIDLRPEVSIAATVAQLKSAKAVETNPQTPSGAPQAVTGQDSV
jgi:hypothetical protein